MGVAVPAVAESMCMNQLAQAGDILVREIGLPQSATLVTTKTISPVFFQALSFSVQEILHYFEGNNVDGDSMLMERAVPITMRNVGNFNLTWTVGACVHYVQKMGWCGWGCDSTWGGLRPLLGALFEPGARCGGLLGMLTRGCAEGASVHASKHPPAPSVYHPLL